MSLIALLREAAADLKKLDDDRQKLADQVQVANKERDETRAKNAAKNDEVTALRAEVEKLKAAAVKPAPAPTAKPHTLMRR